MYVLKLLSSIENIAVLYVCYVIQNICVCCLLSFQPIHCLLSTNFFFFISKVSKRCLISSNDRILWDRTTAVRKRNLNHLSLTPVRDRVHNAEAMMLSFAAENSMSFSQVPKLISLAKALFSDKSALDQLAMDRTSASYRMTHGLALTYKESLLKDLRTYKFSLNIDEATSSNNKRVLAVLVSYFSDKDQKVVVHHLDSISVVKVDSQMLFEAVDMLFTSHNIP